MTAYTKQTPDRRGVPPYAPNEQPTIDGPWHKGNYRLTGSSGSLDARRNVRTRYAWIKTDQTQRRLPLSRPRGPGANVIRRNYGVTRGRQPLSDLPPQHRSRVRLNSDIAGRGTRSMRYINPNACNSGANALSRSRARGVGTTPGIERNVAGHCRKRVNDSDSPPESAGSFSNGHFCVEREPLRGA